MLLVCTLNLAAIFLRAETMNSFNDMTSDVRRTFLNWFNTVEADVNSRWDGTIVKYVYLHILRITDRKS